jgi:(E)-4-hydroxy-3-methylbut-2-enyl-diphosphate synthase
MEAVEHVEKVRVNPGNYADKKKFAVKEYTDADYNRELERLHESFSPLVQRSKARSGAPCASARTTAPSPTAS